MRRAIIPVCLLLLTICAANAQTQPKVEFEVVSVKPSPPASGRVPVYCNGGPGSKDPGLYNCVNMSLSNLVTNAYEINYYQLSAPDWLMRTLFEIHAKVPEGATKDQLPLMLQQMLADRFRLVVHHETRSLQKYDLVVAKNGPKFKESAPPPPKLEDDVYTPRTVPNPGPPRLASDGFPYLAKGRYGMAIMNGRARMQNPAITMRMLASQLAGQMAAPVTDATSLSGKYDIALYWVSDSTRVAGLRDHRAPMLCPRALLQTTSSALPSPRLYRISSACA
jgi:uncharacterized protein (TIGR03435 family)